MDIKEKNTFLDICLITSLFLIARYIDNKTIYVILFYNIPLLLSYIKKKTVTSIFLSCIIVILSSNYTSIPLSILIIEYSLYFIIYLYTSKFTNCKVSYTDIFIGIKSFVISFMIFNIINPTGNILSNLIYLIITLTIFISFTYLCLNLFEKGEDIINLYRKNKKLKQKRKDYKKQWLNQQKKLMNF